VLSGFALDPTRSIYQYNLRSWTRQNSLPANSVNAITQTKDGYVWLGTPAGLVRFDGVEFKLLEMGKSRSTLVTSLSTSKRGGLWFGLESGAFGFCDGTEVWPRGRTEWGGSNLTVHCVLEGVEGDFWIAAQNLAGRLTTNLAYEAVLNTPSGKDFYDVNTAHQDSRGRIWLGTTSRGLYYWQGGVLTRFPDPAVDNLTVRAVAEDKQGRIWIGTELGLLCYNSEFQRQPLPFPWYETRALLVDQDGAVWAGTSGSGVVRFLNGTTSSLQKANGLTDDFVTSLAQDREGNLWIGTRNGLNQLSDVKIPTFGKHEGLMADVNLAVSPSRKGGLWAATSGGITWFDPKRIEPSITYSTEAGLRNPYVKRVFEASNGDLYVINGAMDIEVLSGGRVVASYPNKTWPTALTEDARGVVAAVGGELYRVDTNGLAPYEFTGERPLKCWMFNLFASRDGSLWTASAEGICRVKDGMTQVLTGPDPLGGSKANWLCEDSDGIIWAGLDSGIARIKNGRVKTIRREDGLLDNLIFAIVPDDYGALWVSSGRGFFRVGRQSLNDFADGRTHHIECAAYDDLDAVKTFERNQQEFSGCKTRDGRICFPTAQGVAIVNPTNMPINEIPPVVDVDKVRVNGKDIDKPQQIVAAPGKGDLEFYYTALSYVAPQKNRFRYKLEGYDKEWTEAGGRRLAFYTNLKPGSYRFQVVAANADGVWSAGGDLVQIELRPHYYQTAWFYLLCGVLTCAGLAGVYTWRVGHLHRKQRALQQNRNLLEARVAERTADLARANVALVKEVEQRELEVRERVKAQAELEKQKAALETEIEERKRMELEVEHVHRQLLDASRRAGQADVASGVLHNVGNVLNSVNVSTTVIANRLRKLQIPNLNRAVQMIQHHAGDLGQFLTASEKGRKLPEYLDKLSQHLGQEQDNLLTEIKELADNVEHIKEIVAMQQTYARGSGLVETVEMPELVENALRVTSGAYQQYSICVVRELEAVPPLQADRHKLLQILINLLQNAKTACLESGRTDLTVMVSIRRQDQDRVVVEIADNGVGIAPENLNRIFGHGFTTRKDGHGFGLHSASLAARQMGGMLTARSAGMGKGATFVLDLPTSPPTAAAPDTPAHGHPAGQPASVAP
jgi:ligand-binding sensor domain-containing protein/signal transduction histidine kinase